MTDIRVAAEQARLALQACKVQLDPFDIGPRFASSLADAALASLEAALAALPGDKVNELHAAIMNLPRKPYDGTTSYDAYCLGHRDARHAAAELVLSHPAATPAVEVPQIAGRDGASAAPSDEGSALDADTQRLNWLERQIVEVRVAQRYGSRRAIYEIASWDEEQDEPAPSGLRAAIDDAMKEQK